MKILFKFKNYILLPFQIKSFSKPLLLYILAGSLKLFEKFMATENPVFIKLGLGFKPE
jgi:hypothetical protein